MVTSSQIQSDRRAAKWQITIRQLTAILFDVTWMFFVGGFSFYLAIVVPIGGNTIGPEVQGLVTEHVSKITNIFGLIAGIIWVFRSHAQKFGWSCLSQGVVLIASSIALMVLHAEVVASLNLKPMNLFSDWTFYGIHRLYMWITLLQWLAMVALAINALWRDRRR